jgi:hypothetical protein
MDDRDRAMPPLDEVEDLELRHGDAEDVVGGDGSISGSLALQQSMDNESKFISTLSGIQKQVSDTNSTQVTNTK